MKKSAVVLLSITAACLCIILGIFIGRNLLPNYFLRNYSEETEGNTVTTETLNGLININTATANDFMQLPGIGETIAGRIIAYREENGNFTTIEDLLHVEGIGYATLYKISDYITVGG